MQQELVLGQVDLLFVGEDDAMGGFPQRILELVPNVDSHVRNGLVGAARGRRICFGSYQGDNLGRLSDQSMRKLFVELDQIADVHIAVVSLEQGVFPQLVSGFVEARNG